jgi:hypothetical protein
MSFRFRVYAFSVLAWVILTGPSFGQTGDTPAVKTIYVIPSSHWDLGFLEAPIELRRRLGPHIDEVIANCKADREFRWTVESVWQLDAWVAAGPEQSRVEDCRSHPAAEAFYAGSRSHTKDN